MRYDPIEDLSWRLDRAELLLERIRLSLGIPQHCGQDAACPGCMSGKPDHTGDCPTRKEAT